MKKYIMYLGVACGLVFTSCRKEYKEIGDLPSKVEGITATWILNDCSTIDKASIVEETMTITPFFYTRSSMPNITFAMEADNGIYTCDTSNIAFQFFGGTKGKWRFDNNNFPTKVILTPSGSTTTIEMKLAATIRPTDTYLKLDKSVLCNGKETSVYRLSFIRN
jgi:hypothetical protein